MLECGVALREDIETNPSMYVFTDIFIHSFFFSLGTDYSLSKMNLNDKIKPPGCKTSPTT